MVDLLSIIKPLSMDINNVSSVIVAMSYEVMQTQEKLYALG